MKTKREYEPPKLQKYGDLTAQTKAMSAGAKNDHSGGGPGANKTN